MPLIGVAVLPVAPGAAQSPTSTLLSHLSHLYPSEPHEDYHIDHRLFVNTSSLLPGSKPKERLFTQILTTSRYPDATFVTTIATGTSDPATIIIPPSSQDSFTQLLITKLQPQWAHRQSMSVEGTGLNLPVQDAGQWAIRLGDLKVAAGSGRSAGTTNTGTVRGVLIELQYSPNNTTAAKADDTTHEIDRYTTVFRDLVKSLFQDAGSYKFEDLKFIVAQVDAAKVLSAKDAGMTVCRIYTDLLRGSRA